MNKLRLDLRPKLQRQNPRRIPNGIGGSRCARDHDAKKAHLLRLRTIFPCIHVTGAGAPAWTPLALQLCQSLTPVSIYAGLPSDPNYGAERRVHKAPPTTVDPRMLRCFCRRSEQTRGVHGSVPVAPCPFLRPCHGTTLRDPAPCRARPHARCPCLAEYSGRLPTEPHAVDRHLAVLPAFGMDRSNPTRASIPPKDFPYLSGRVLVSPGWWIPFLRDEPVGRFCEQHAEVVLQRPAEQVMFPEQVEMPP